MTDKYKVCQAREKCVKDTKKVRRSEEAQGIFFRFGRKSKDRRVE